MLERNCKSVLLTLFCMLIFSLNQNANASCLYEKTIKGEELAIGVMLSWSTTKEEGNSNFSVERSQDGIEFTTIGEIKGAGNSEQLQEYSFLDVMAKSDRLFYRLKQIDFDNTYSFTEVLAINKKIPNEFMVVKMSSVSVTSTFDVTLDATNEGSELMYSLKDWKGNEIGTEYVTLDNGINNISLDLSENDNGIYKLILSVDEEVETLTIKKVTDENRKKPMAKLDKN